MSTSDVRNVESLRRLRVGVLGLAGDWEKTLQEIRLSVQRAEQHFGELMPQYWRRQSELAERELTEARDDLQRKQSAARAVDRPSALEAQKRVARAKARLELCRDRSRVAKSIAVEVRHQCDEILGPLADMTDQCDRLLPAAADKLKALLDALDQYTEMNPEESA